MKEVQQVKKDKSTTEELIHPDRTSRKKFKRIETWGYVLIHLEPHLF